jgi:Family of unknown function (DUF6338)
MLPSTVQELAILLLFVIPGTVYQGVLDRFRGPVAAEQDSSNRIVRAVAASAVFDSVYAVAIGPHLVSMTSGKSALSGLSSHSRSAGLLGLVLLVLIPSIVALLEAKYDRRKSQAVYDSTPTSWDFLFKSRGSCWIRLKLKDQGGWIGGWYGTKSFTSSYPQPSDIYLESEYKMTSDGKFTETIVNTGGVYVAGERIELVEIIEA